MGQRENGLNEGEKGKQVFRDDEEERKGLSYLLQLTMLRA